jgi:hypothetical protein
VSDFAVTDEETYRNFTLGYTGTIRFGNSAP